MGVSSAASATRPMRSSTAPTRAITLRGRQDRPHHHRPVAAGRQFAGDSRPAGATPSGQLVPLEALADVTLSSGPEQVNHRERVRAITIEVSPPMEMPLQVAMQRIQSEIVGPLRESGRRSPRLSHRAGRYGGQAERGLGGAAHSISRSRC